MYAVSLENSGRINLYPPSKERVVRPLKRPAMAPDVLGAKLLRLYQVADAGGVRRR